MSLQKQKIPKFKITGRLDSVNCCITQPFTGEVSATVSITRSVKEQVVGKFSEGHGILSLWLMFVFYIYTKAGDFKV